MFEHTYLRPVFHKIFFLSVVLMLFKNAESQSRFGIMAGVGNTSLYKFPFSVQDYNKFSSKTSFWGGLTADFSFSKDRFSLFTSAAYNIKGYDYSIQNQNGTANSIKDSGYKQNLNYVDINLNLRKRFRMGAANSFYIGTGPVANIFVSGSEKISASYFGSILPSVNTTKSNLTVGNAPGAYKRVFFSWAFSAGFQFNKFNIWLNYNLPLDHYYQDANRAIPHKIKTFGVNAGYTLFSTKKPKKEQKEIPAKPLTPVIDSTDTDGDGIIDIEDRCPGHKGTAKYKGCPVPDSDGDGINDDEDKCPFVAGVASNNGCPPFRDRDNSARDTIFIKVPVKDTVYLSTSGKDTVYVNAPAKDTIKFIVYFEANKSVLRGEGFNTLSEVVRLLKANPKLVVMFKGHTDVVGSVERNSARSFERAMVCADYVASFFIPRNRMVVAGYSNKMPAADLNDRLLQWKNRRVEVCVYEIDE